MILILFCQLYAHVFVKGTTGGSVNVAQTISKSMSVGAMSIYQRMPIGVAEAISISVTNTMAVGVPKTMTVVTVEGVCVSLGLSHSGGVGLGLGLPLVVVVGSARAGVVPVVPVIAGPVPWRVSRPVVRALSLKLATTFLLTLFLVEMRVHNEGAYEDKDEDGRETHFEKLRTSHLV